jgi:dipeptidyl aminopeptidase/acylaminoacyl peptidase
LAQSDRPSFRATDVTTVRVIDDVTLSPSGRNVAYTLRGTSPPTADSPSPRRRLYVAPSYGREQSRQLTRTGRDARQPAWHPDGDLLAFVRPVDGTPQIFVLSLSGGEPYQLTAVPFGATHPQWGPGGNRLLFASSVPEAVLQRRSGQVPPSERPGRSPQDTLRRAPPDTLLVLRHARTLDPVDTLSLSGDYRLRPDPDTSRRLRTPAPGRVPDSLHTLRLDSLRILRPDSQRTLLGRMQMLPDTTLRPVAPDTAASPTGDLLQGRRWLEQRPAGETQVVTRPDLFSSGGSASAPTYRHYFLVDVPETVDTGTPPRPAVQPVTRGYRSFRGGTWLPGGTQILVSAPPPSDVHPDRVQKRNLYVVDLSPYRVQRLLQIDGYALSSPRVTSDGTTLAFRAESLTQPHYAADQIGLFELDGRSDPELITAGFDRDPQTFRWSPDGWYLYVTAPSRGGRPLYRFAPFARDDTTAERGGRTSLKDDYPTSRDTFSLESTMVRSATYDQVLPASRVVQALDVTDSNALYAALGPETPSELYANTISFGNEQRITHHNDWTADRRLARSESVTAWNDGVRVKGRVTPPLATPDSVPAPVVVWLRGGPPPLDGQQPLAAWVERQYLAGMGYGVVEVWPRGSVGYGAVYRRQNFQDWGPGPARDVVALVDAVLQRPWADASRQVLAGRSYGGLLAAWLVGHTDRFRAAVAQGGLYDLAAFFEESGAGEIVPAQFGGVPWAEAPPPSTPLPSPTPVLAAGLLPPTSDSARVPGAALRHSAPITSAHRIQTPLLLLHGAADRTVPPGQAERLYHRLKRLRRPVEYVRYPGVGHDFSAAAPGQRVDRLVRLHEFFARYVTLPAPSRRDAASGRP